MLGLDNNSGAVMVVLGGLDHTRLCSVSKDFGKISPDSCKAIYAKLLASKAAGTVVTLYFFDRSVFSAWDGPFRYFYYAE